MSLINVFTSQLYITAAMEVVVSTFDNKFFQTSTTFMLLYLKHVFRETSVQKY